MVSALVCYQSVTSGDNSDFINVARSSCDHVHQWGIEPRYSNLSQELVALTVVHGIIAPLLILKINLPLKNFDILL